MSNSKANLENFDFNQFQEEAIARLKSGQPLTGHDGVMTPLLKRILEAALEGEMDAHITECKDDGQPNRRNGKTKKTLKTGTGSFELETPRDREGSFEPEIVKKRQTILNESLDNKVLSLYALGMSYESITDHLHEMYGLEISTAKISQITDKLLPVITEWRTRPLEAIYPIVFLDAMHFKVREEGKVVSKAIYSILGVNKNGRKEIIGIYLSESEGARFWLSVLNDLRIRGIEDILIASIDGLKGFPEAIAEVFPKTEIQLCVVHQIRNSLKYVVSKDQKAFMLDLRLVYRAVSPVMPPSNIYLNWAKNGARNTPPLLSPGMPTGKRYRNILNILKTCAVLFIRQILSKDFIGRFVNTRRAKEPLLAKMR